MPTNVELSKMIEALKEQNESLISKVEKTEDLEKQNEDLKEKIDELFQMFKTANSNNMPRQEASKEEEKITIISNVIGKNGIQVNPGYDLIFYGFGDSKSFTIQEVRELLRSDRIVQNFRMGLLSFEDNKWYSYFKISAPFFKTDDEIIKNVNGSTQEFTKFLEDSTNHHNYSAVEYTLLYRITRLLKDGKVIISEDKRRIIQEFFKQPIDNALNILSIIEN
jgi:hypothetical protein